ncbi:MAG: GTP cyclohydrolase I [Ferrimicrobium sp.]
MTDEPTLDREAARGAFSTILRYLEQEAGASFPVDIHERTPDRMLDLFDELLGGYRETEDEIQRYRVETSPVAMRSLAFHSLCEHHLLPFFGVIDLAYIPSTGGGIVGLSTLVRSVQRWTRRLQLQERMTEEIASDVFELTRASAVVIRVRAEHLCLSMRGVNRPGVQLFTQADRGVPTPELLALLTGGSEGEVDRR